MISTIDQRKAPYLSFSTRKNLTEAFLRLTEVVKGLTDDKTNFKRGFWFHLSKAPQKKVFFQKCNGPRICFSAEEKGKRDVLKRHRWLRKQSDGISALNCTFPHIQTLSKT